MMPFTALLAEGVIGYLSYPIIAASLEPFPACHVVNGDQEVAWIFNQI